MTTNRASRALPIVGVTALLLGCAASGARPEAAPAGQRAAVDRSAPASAAGPPGGDAYASFHAERARLERLLSRAAEGEERSQLLLTLADLHADAERQAHAELMAADERCAALRCGEAERRRRDDLELLARRFADAEIELLARVAAEHERFTRRDEVLVRLGTELLERGRIDQAMDHLRELITEYPGSPHVGAAFHALGEHYFAQGDLDKARQFYEKVIALGDPGLAPFARYKLGWCWFNLGDFTNSLQAFVQAAAAAERLGTEAGIGLQREAHKDMVRAYAQIGRADKAAMFFTKVAPQSVDELLERLASLLFDDGKYGDAIAVHRELLARVECSTLLARSQLSIFEAQLLLGERDAVRVEARRLAEVFVKLGECLPATELADLAELGSDARETLKEQAAAARKEYDATRAPAALDFAEELEAAAESIY